MNVKVSTDFKKHVKNTILSIAVFMLTYIVLLVLAILLTVALGAIGIWLIFLKPMLITFGLGIGLISSGVIVLIFLVKFIFASTKIDRSHLHEVSRIDQPELFALIEDIVLEVHTSFPKKVYLSHDVNASVFYDSSFWSMFLPVKKNLQIGLGLINSTTKQELKAILGHEFGHFSQRSMKVGSYVYNVNQIIYNMLYKNEGLDNMISKWANTSGYLTVFSGISVFIIRNIQRILQKLYDYMNIRYMALSREMEFHADEIAANVAGSQALSTSLLRLEFANHALDSVLGFYSDKIKANVKSGNIYREQQFVMQFLAQKNGYPLQGTLPVIGLDNLGKYNKSKVNINSQWASHPSTEDRVAALEKLNIIKEDTDDTSAMELLGDIETIVGKVSNGIFSQVSYEHTPSTLAIGDFEHEFTTNFTKNNFDEVFNDFYAVNNPVVVMSDVQMDIEMPPSPEDLFSDDAVQSTFELYALQNDKLLLRAIQTDESEVKTFDYEGVKYAVHDIESIIQRLEEDLKIKEQEVTNNNILVYQYFKKLAVKYALENEFADSYEDFIQFHEGYEEKQKFYDQLIDHSNFIFSVTPYQDIEVKLGELAILEPRLKTELQKILSYNEIQHEIEKEILDSLHSYLDKNRVYFHVDQYDDKELNILFTAIHQYSYLLSSIYFWKKKQVLKIQKQLLLRYKEEKQLAEML